MKYISYKLIDSMLLVLNIAFCIIAIKYDNLKLIPTCIVIQSICLAGSFYCSYAEKRDKRKYMTADRA